MVLTPRLSRCRFSKELADSTRGATHNKWLDKGPLGLRYFTKGLKFVTTLQLLKDQKSK